MTKSLLRGASLQTGIRVPSGRDRQAGFRQEISSDQRILCLPSAATQSEPFSHFRTEICLGFTSSVLHRFLLTYLSPRNTRVSHPSGNCCNAPWSKYAFSSRSTPCLQLNSEPQATCDANRHLCIFVQKSVLQRSAHPSALSLKCLVRNEVDYQGYSNEQWISCSIRVPVLRRSSFSSRSCVGNALAG